jgi:hypothetical protein
VEVEAKSSNSVLMLWKYQCALSIAMPSPRLRKECICEQIEAFREIIDALQSEVTEKSQVFNEA